MSSKESVEEALTELERVINSLVKDEPNVKEVTRLVRKLRKEWNTYRSKHKFENASEWLYFKKKQYGKIHSYSDYLALQVITQLAIQAEKEYPVWG